MVSRENIKIDKQNAAVSKTTQMKDSAGNKIKKKPGWVQKQKPIVKSKAVNKEKEVVSNLICDNAIIDLTKDVSVAVEVEKKVKSLDDLAEDFILNDKKF